MQALIYLLDLSLVSPQFAVKTYVCVPAAGEVVEKPNEIESRLTRREPGFRKCIFQLRHHFCSLILSQFVCLPNLLIPDLAVAGASELIGSGAVTKPKIERFQLKLLKPRMLFYFPNFVRGYTLFGCNELESLLHDQVWIRGLD